MQIFVVRIFNVRSDFSKTTFNIEYNLDGRRCVDQNLILKHKQFDQLKTMESTFEIPDDHKYDTFQEVLEEKLSKKET